MTGFEPAVVPPPEPPVELPEDDPPLPLVEPVEEELELEDVLLPVEDDEPLLDALPLFEVPPDDDDPAFFLAEDFALLLPLPPPPP